MQCKVCEYRLWNLKARQCPECGTAFCVSDYEFVPSSVQFCCPHCGQAYYGTGYKGHLVPEAFLCVKCGRPVHMNDMVLLPAEGLEEEQTETFRLPWLERAKRGWFRSWFSTVGLGMVSPGKLIRAVPAESSGGPAWWFMIVTSFLIPGVWLVAVAMITLVAALVRGGGVGNFFLVGGFLVTSVAAPVVMIAVLAVWGIVTHGLLRLTGGTLTGPGRTYQCLCYSSGPNILTAIPCLPYVGPIWWLISAVITVKEGQRVHGGRAAFAVLTPPVLGIGTLIGLYIWFIVSFMAKMPATATMPAGGLGMMPGAMSVSTVEGQKVLDGLRAYANGHNDQGPRHAIQLVDEGYLKADGLLMPTSITTKGDVPIGYTTLDVFEQLDRDERVLAVQAAVKALPAGTVAHRLGDFIFTHHGIDFSQADPDLWALIQWPDPAANRSLAPTDTVIVYPLNGSAVPLPVSAFQIMLNAQNAIRANHGLPALPSPSTIRHNKAVGAPAEQPEF